MNDRWSSRAGPTGSEMPTAAWQVKGGKPSDLVQPHSFSDGWRSSQPCIRKGPGKRCHGPGVCTQSNWGAKQSYKMLRPHISSRPGTLMLVFRVLQTLWALLQHTVFSTTGSEKPSKLSVVFRLWLHNTIPALQFTLHCMKSLGLLTSGTNMESCTIPILWISKTFSAHDLDQKNPIPDIQKTGIKYFCKDELVTKEWLPLCQAEALRRNGKWTVKDPIAGLSTASLEGTLGSP